MNDPLVLVLFLATWGGIILLFRRLADDFRKASVGQSARSVSATVEDAATDELEHDTDRVPATELRLVAGELERTATELTDALAHRAERLKELMEQADRTLAQLAAATELASRSAPHAPEPAPPLPAMPAVPAVPAVPPVPLQPEPVAALPGQRAGLDDVLRLAGQGYDPDTIARLTNRGREEVRLLVQRAGGPVTPDTPRVLNGTTGTIGTTGAAQ